MQLHLHPYNYFFLHRNKKSLCNENKDSPILSEHQPAQLHRPAKYEHEVFRSNRYQATKDLIPRDDTEIRILLERKAAPLTVQRVLPCSVCFFCHVPCPGYEVLTQIGDNRFSTKHL